MKPINYKSDFDLILRLETCVHNDDGTEERTDIGFPDCDFTATFWTASKVSTYVASCIGGQTKNCFNDNGRIHVVFDNHKLSKGRLMVELHTSLPNGIYPDGTQDIYEPHPLDIELVDGAGECPTRIQAEAALAVVYRSAYEDAVAAGYTGTQQEYAQLVAQLPQSVETAQSVAQSAVSLETSAASLETSSASLEGASTSLTEASSSLTKASTSLTETADKINTLAATAAEEVGHVNLLLSDLAKSKLEIWAALRDRGFDIPSSASSQEMAELIRQIEYGEGVLSKIGYESTDDYKWLMAQIDQAYMYKQMYEKGEIDTLKDCGVFAPKVTVRDGNADFLFADKNNVNSFKNASTQYFPKYENLRSMEYMFAYCQAITTAPPLDMSMVTSARFAFYSCQNLSDISALDLSKVQNGQSMFHSCTSLREVNDLNIGSMQATYLMFYGCSQLRFASFTDTHSLEDCRQMFQGCQLLERIVGLDVGNVKSGMAGSFFTNTRALTHLYMINHGKGDTRFDFNNCPMWGTTDEEARQSVIYTLLTNSYDRAANGLSAATIQLHANTKAVLTEEEIAAITAKGYTIA